MDFSSLEINFNVWTSEFENQEAFILSKKQNFDNLLKHLPPFHLAVTTDRNDVADIIQIILLAFNGKIIETEQVSSGEGLESSKLFKRVNSSEFALCHGVKGKQDETDLISEYIGSKFIQRTKACLFVSEDGSNICIACVGKPDANNNTQFIEPLDLNITAKYPSLSISKSNSATKHNQRRNRSTPLERELKAKKFKKCSDCEKDIPSENFMEHIQNPHPPQRKTKQCCGERLTTEQYFEHRDKDHSKQSETMICEKCGFNSKIRSKYLKHIAYHHPKKLLICKICNDNEINLAGFRSHYTIVHTNNKPFKCKHCEYRSNNRYNVKLHISKLHKEVVKGEEYDDVIKDGEFEKFTDKELLDFCVIKTLEDEDIDPTDPKKDFRKRKGKGECNENKKIK